MDVAAVVAGWLSMCNSRVDAGLASGEMPRACWHCNARARASLVMSSASPRSGSITIPKEEEEQGKQGKGGKRGGEGKRKKKTKMDFPRLPSKNSNSNPSPESVLCCAV